ncbi:tetratricopeptide repeat protein [Pedosphaera parvula]|uniref:TPR repeat-containing protein n=1 Tax=Pedosphaera parvula (strain Ellin514) TaxID=320771 RepID=B9XPN2_PEDPL|nr:tetratricopeptide repeat protein [Pedosphaera parvula]EEF58155.1 TPR repeat-containing protein [Pedosphaera parvula Ellin514]
MNRCLLIFVAALLTAPWTFAQSNTVPLAQRHWFETRTAHFNVYSCGASQDVARISSRLEQFRDAYAQLAGAQAVASPPIAVMAFPDVKSMEPFLPLYQGKPIHLAGFFHRGSDQNLIVLALSANEDGLDVIFHEYTHLLLRHNDLIWPPWLQEGMAEIYSTFEATGRGVHIGKPIPHHLHTLTEQPLMPLGELFAVAHDSPQYNEREHQGIFYAESWLLTHYLMVGNPARKAQFSQLTKLLRQGQSAEQAFTNAFHTSLPAMEAELHHYLERQQFESLALVLSSDVSLPRNLAMRNISTVETAFHLGNELLRIGRGETAEKYFSQAHKIAPASPLPYEGLGLLAAHEHKSEAAIDFLKQAFDHGSTSFLAHYVYAQEKFRQTADSRERYTKLEKDAASAIREELEKSIAVMPSFGPAQHLLGFFEIVQGDDLASAEQHLQRAIQLEPENQSYLFSLAQAQIARNEPDAARQTLDPLRLPNVDKKLRQQAEQILAEIPRSTPK